jgi:hypothetical protein
MRKTTLLTAGAMLGLVCLQCSQGAAPPPGASAASPASSVSVQASSPAAPPSGALPERVSATPVPGVPPRVRLIVPSGTLLPIRMQTTHSTDASRRGDAALAVLTKDVPLEGFKLQEGAEVRGRVTTVLPAKRVKGRARLVLEFDEVMVAHESLMITTKAIDATAPSTKSKDKKIIGGGALGGLIVGALKDGTKGAAVGTLIGAAAGTGAVLVIKGDEVEIPRGARLTLRVVK